MLIAVDKCRRKRRKSKKNDAAFNAVYKFAHIALRDLDAKHCLRPVPGYNWLPIKMASGGKLITVAGAALELYFNRSI